jgi:protoporphyrinogen oxidase
MDPQRWAVVGGGLLGMTLAHRLAQAGHKVTLFEAAERLGGLASAWDLDGVVWDRHYHVTLLSDLHLRTLWTELGLEKELRWATTRTGFYSGGRLHSMSNALEFLRFPPLGLIDKLRLAATILHASRVKDPLPLESIPVSDWLRRWSGERTFETIWLPLLKAKLGERYRETSAAFLWATIARMYAARRTGLKKEMFGYVPGGYARILDRFADKLATEGVDIRTGHAAERIAPAPGGGIRVGLRNGHPRNGHPDTAGGTFDQVAVTVPAPVAARVCQGLTADETARLRGVQYLGILCASLLLRKPLTGFYVTNITDPGIPFTAIVEMTTLVDRAELGGNTLVYLPKYADPHDAAFALSDRELQESFLAALERMVPAFDRRDLLSFRVSRVKHVFALPTLDYSRRLPPVTTSVPGLHLINAAHIVHGTLNVNETVQLADRTAERLCRETSPTGSAMKEAIR